MSDFSFLENSPFKFENKEVLNVFADLNAKRTLSLFLIGAFNILFERFGMYKTLLYENCVTFVAKFVRTKGLKC